MYMKFPGYYDFRGLDLSIATYMAAISNRLYEGFAKPPWGTRKHHLLSSHIPKKFFKSLIGLCVRDKEDEFTQWRLFQRVARNT